MKKFLINFKEIITRHPLTTFALCLLWLLHLADKIVVNTEASISYFYYETLSAFLGFWIITRALKLYIHEEKKWLFDKRDLKALLLYALFSLATTTILFSVNSFINAQYGVQTTSGFIPRYGELISSVLLNSILFQFLILYFIAITAGDKISLRESIYKAKRSIYVLICIALFMAFFQLLAQYSSGTSHDIFLILKQLSSLIYFFALITIYKIRIIQN